jgi:hypothetical protein
MKIYSYDDKSGRGFVIKYQENRKYPDIVRYNDNGISHGIFGLYGESLDDCELLDTLDIPVDNVKIRFMKPNGDVHLRYSLNSNFDIDFIYDKESKYLKCSYGNKLHKIKLITKRQEWEEQNPGPYVTKTICADENPYNLPYVYWDGTVMLSCPSQIDLIIPENRLNEFNSNLC